MNSPCTHLTLSRVLLFGFFVLSFSTSCSKDEREPDKEELPILGTCRSVDLNAGLTMPEEGVYKYRSAGDSDIIIAKNTDYDALTVTLTYEPFPDQHVSVQLWEDSGYAHENLNGKHLKDRIGTNRTIIFPDGTKITCVATGPMATVTAISIYDGATVHHLNVSCDKVEYSATNTTASRLLDEQQPDGETSMFETDGAQFILYNAYTEDTPGNKVHQRVNLGSVEKGKPNLVNDLYDDPRLAHT